MENAEVTSLGCINGECSSTKCMMIYFENTEIHQSITIKILIHYTAKKIYLQDIHQRFI